MNKTKKHKPRGRVFNFSAGKSSALMTIRYYKPGDIVLFCDTGREHEKTYKFLHDFQAYENIPVTTVKFDNGATDKEIKRVQSWLDGFKNGKIIPEGNDIETFENKLAELKIKSAAETPFDKYLSMRNYREIPNMAKRGCTREMKVKTARRYMRLLGYMAYDNFIGFRADEQNRVNKNKSRWDQVLNKFPLHADGTTKQQVNDYWKNKPYTLEIPPILGNCTLCFMKGKNAVMAILREHPELADPWIADEEKSKMQFGHTYFENITIREIRSIAQNNLFKDFDLEEISPAFDCACTSI